jgi:hypothetical protein
MTENITTRAQRRATRKNKGRTVVAGVLAVLAVTGIGAAATSAAWTDNVLFSAQAGAATFNLQGSLDGSTWKESDNANSIELVIPASQLANLLPGQTRNIDLYVKNTGSVSAALTGTAAFASGATFTTNPTASLSDLAATLTPASGAGASDKFVLTIKAPDDWATSNQGKTGTVVVTVSGTATA